MFGPFRHGNSVELEMCRCPAVRELHQSDERNKVFSLTMVAYDSTR